MLASGEEDEKGIWLLMLTGGEMAQDWRGMMVFQGFSGPSSLNAGLKT